MPNAHIPTRKIHQKEGVDKALPARSYAYSIYVLKHVFQIYSQCCSCTYRRCKKGHIPARHPPHPHLSFHLVERRVPDGNTVNLGQHVSSPCLAQALSLSCRAIGKALESRHTTPDRSSVRLPHRLCRANQAKGGRQCCCVRFKSVCVRLSTLEKCRCCSLRTRCSAVLCTGTYF